MHRIPEVETNNGEYREAMGGAIQQVMPNTYWKSTVMKLRFGRSDEKNYQ